MLQTRVPNDEFHSDMLVAVTLLDQVADLMDRHLPPTMTDDQRQHIPKPQFAFAKAVHGLVAAAELHPEMAAVAKFDGPAVLEDIANLWSLAPVGQRLDSQSQRVRDALLRWNAEVYVPSLALYGMAKIGAKTDGALKDLVEPMAEAFGKGRKSKSGI